MKSRAIDIIESVLLIAAIAVTLMSGMLLGERWRCVEDRLDAIETRESHTQNRLKTLDEIILGK